MPEILTKYPESALYVLKSAGAKCGVGIKPDILTQCPTDHFCALPHGEICVYGINEINKLMQISPVDLVDYVQSTPSIYSNVNLMLLMIACLFGMIFGMWLMRK